MRPLTLVAIPVVATACQIGAGSPTAPLLALPQSPGTYTSDYALVGTRFPVVATLLSLPGGDCGGGPCPSASETLTAVSATCDGDACSAVADAATDGAAHFLVTPTRAGQTVVHLHARGESGDDFSGSVNLTFVSSAHVEVHHDDHQLTPLVNRSKYAALPG